MRTMFLTLTALVSVTFASSAFASPMSRANYDFVANNSYRANDGSCVQSVFHATQVANLLVISDSSTGTSITEAIKLNVQQIAQFTKLAQREWGESVSVKVQFGSQTLIFKGESCGRMQCDSLEINDGKNTTALDQAIHGMDSIKCER